MWNRHRESKTRNFTKLVQFKGFLTWGERDTHNLSMLTDFTSSAFKPINAQRSRLASPSSESQPSSSVAGTELTAFSQISAHASGVWRHPNTLVPIPIGDFYFDISEWHILSAHAWTPALMLHLTNPCAKQKVLSLTKLKGKIYKTKSLGNYITAVRLELWGMLRIASMQFLPGPF